MPGPLAGIRVLDFTRVLAGPWATQALADMGAEVIKVERPDSGDDTRGFGPPFVPSNNGSPALSTYFLSANRGKHSITIDLTKPEGQQLARDLAKKSDILVENYKVGSLGRLGLDYSTISALNSRLIYCSITGFGQTGPHRFRPGYDLVVQAMGGLMSITGEMDGEPMRCGVAVTDILTALYATTAILAALYEREKSNLGQHIDLGLLDVQIATLANQATYFLGTGKAPRRYGNAHASVTPYQSFPTKDGRMIIAVANDGQFASLAVLLGMAELADDPSFKTNSERVRNRQILLPLLSEQFLKKSTAEWLADLDRAQIPAGPVNTIDAAFEDPQIAARNLVVEFPPGNHGSIRVPANPTRFSRTPVSYEMPPPELGQHTDHVLAQVLGKSRESIEMLREKGVV
jgi:crotonobetainyl-CoA:carnitine CoA-transferase CaiB-like acyl-CoA transferase